MSDLESRIKAIEDRLYPNPEKISSIQASNQLKYTLNDKKEEPKETHESVIWRIIAQAEKVPELEKENTRLRKHIIENEKKIQELEENNSDLEFRLKTVTELNDL